MKKMIERIRLAETWQERVAIARDKYPGTKFDQIFLAVAAARLAKSLGMTGNLELGLRNLGAWLYNAIQRGESQSLHDMADALNRWKRHTPRPNYELVALFSMAGRFPPGWRPFLGVNRKTKKPKWGKPGPRVAVRDIKKSLARHDPDFREEDWDNRRRNIQRYAREFGIELDQTPGVPKS